jgi:hypothetical protein
MAVALDTEGGLRIGATAALFASRRVGTGPGPFYDVTADGKRFLISQPIEDADQEPLTVTLGWPALVKKTGTP